MKNTYSIEAIKKFIDDVITKHNIDRNELDNQGAVYYCNGNDSTAFDYTANGRTCEFYVYWKNGDGAIKTTVNEEIIHCYILTNYIYLIYPFSKKSYVIIVVDCIYPNYS